MLALFSMNLMHGAAERIASKTCRLIAVHHTTAQDQQHNLFEVLPAAVITDEIGQKLSYASFKALCITSKYLRGLLLDKLKNFPSDRYWQQGDGVFKELYKNDHPAESLVYLPDGSLKFCESYEGIIVKYLWNGADKQILGFENKTSLPKVISPDGTTYLSALFKGVRLYDAATNKILKRYGEQRSLIEEIAYSHDSSPATSIAYSPDGKIFASGNQTIYLWDLATTELIHTFEGNEHVVSSLAFSDDGRLLASGSAADNCIYLWDLATKKLIRTLKCDQKGRCGGVSSIAFSPHATLLAAGYNDRIIRLWRTKE